MKSFAALAACIILAIAIAVALLNAVDPGASRAVSTAPTLSSFVSRVEHGASGTFSAVYRFTAAANNENGTVVVAQRARPASDPFPTGAGEWSFTLSFGSVVMEQWIERGTVSIDCFRARTAGALRCTGPATFSPSIGHMIAIDSFVPGQTAEEIEGLPGEQRRASGLMSRPRLSLSQRSTARFGRIECLTLRQQFAVGEAPPASWCIDASGVIVSTHGDPLMPVDWMNVALVRWSSFVPAHSFQPLRRVSEPFILPAE